MSELAARGFIPPQPNLGPEPWPEDQPATALFIALGAVACLFLGWFAWRMSRRMRAQTNPGSLAARDQPDDTPRGRLLALSHSMRESLAVQFGAPWRSQDNRGIVGRCTARAGARRGRPPGIDQLPRPSRSAQIRSGTVESSSRVARERAGSLAASSGRDQEENPGQGRRPTKSQECKCGDRPSFRTRNSPSTTTTAVELALNTNPNTSVCPLFCSAHCSLPQGVISVALNRTPTMSLR